MDIIKVLNDKRTIYVVGGIAALGIGYYLYKKGKLPFLDKIIGGGKKYKMGYVTQGRFQGNDMPEATAIHFATPRPKESEVAPNGSKLQNSDYVYVSKTGEFDGKFKVRGKWTDKDGNLGAVWIGLKKDLGKKSPEKIYTWENKGEIQIKDK